MDAALAGVVFNNPLVMRELLPMLSKLGLKMTAAWGDAVVEIGYGSYFKSFAETYAASVLHAGLLPAEAVAAWLRRQQRSMEDGTFFASCNYCTYLARPI
jgi:hypothetical protein